MKYAFCFIKVLLFWGSFFKTRYVWEIEATIFPAILKYNIDVK